jgi:DNA polymerase III subunit epsilon
MIGATGNNAGSHVARHFAPVHPPEEVFLITPPVALELFPELPPGAPAPRARKQRAAPPQVLANANVLPRADDVQAMAQALEAHGDYRVQRRLKPTLQWPGTPSHSITRALILDTETTGLDQSREQIIELALLRVDIDNATGLPVGSVQVYDGLEDPGKPIPREVVALTGIQDADVKGQRLDAERVAALLEAVDLVIAHNAGFDRPFVEARFSQFAQLTWACSFADIDWKAQGRSSAKLESLAQANGWFYDAHRAEMDCHALLAVLARKLPEVPHTGLSQLVQAAAKPSYALQASNAPFEAKDKLKSRGYRWHAEQRVWHTRLKSEAELSAECEWLKDNVYGQRLAVVQIEKQDARVRFSNRAGVVTQRQL